VVYGDAVHVNKDGFFLNYFPAIESFSFRALTRTCFICQPACFVRREAYERVGGVDPRWHFTMDWDLWCRLALSGAKFHYLPEVLAAVRYYSGTKTLSGNLRRYIEIFRIERIYGHKLFPMSGLGAYLFDLSLYETKSPFEMFAFSVLNKLKKIKRKITTDKNIVLNMKKTNYGFYPLDSRVEDWGTIHLPWYEPSRWSLLRLKVYPETSEYQVKINGSICQKISYENGYLVVQLPRLDTPQREISIRCKETKIWRLLEFGCEFEIDTNTRTGG
jgi:hypothetical protein